MPHIPQAFAEASSALHPYTDGQVETRAFPTVASTPVLPSSDSTSPKKQSMNLAPSQVPKKLKPKDLQEVSGDENHESWDVFSTHYK